MSTMEQATGRWREILPALGVPAGFLNGKHQACPLCGGKDRARFTDSEGKGSYFCNQCGAGTGMQLVMKLQGWDFAEAAKQVDRIIGNLETRRVRVPAKRHASPSEMNSIWNRGTVVTREDPVGRYLAKRGIDDPAFSRCFALRYVENLRYSHDLTCPGMVAKFFNVFGKPSQLHRTYLTHEGEKISSDPARKFMPGTLPHGGAIRLGDPAETMGIAEGIETALSAAILYRMTVWATTSAQMLKLWEPPLTARRIVIFGDHDENFTGQAAAYELANRLNVEAVRNGMLRQIEVRIPEVRGHDFNDVLMEVDSARIAN